MKRFITLLFVVALSLTFTINADAMLLGDWITLQHATGSGVDFVPYPDKTRFVEQGSIDLWSFPAFYGVAYAVDPEDADVSVYFSGGSFYGDPTPPDPFNGLVISDIDAKIYGVTVDTNINYYNKDILNGLVWDDSRLSYNDHSVSFNFAGLNVSDEAYFNAKLRFGDHREPGPAPVPESSTLLLLGGGVIGAFWIKKRRD